MVNLQLKKRILDIAYTNKLSHLGSYFSSVDIIDSIYANMKPNDIFILSSGHAALALYCCIEKYYGKNAEELLKKHGGHPHHDEQNGLYCSTGSLGLGITVALGRAIANPDRTVHVLISDGECAEGSVWESLKTIHEQKIKNIVVHVNVNGYAAYMNVDVEYLVKRLKAFLPDIKIYYTSVEQFSFLKGLNAHYHIMKEIDYNQALKELNEKTICRTFI
jgi:transketolase